MKNKYYKVTAKCGHVGRKYYIQITFPICAEDGKDAAKRVRNYPRVKHDHKDAILNVTQINYDEYLYLLALNNNDNYL